jgi:hypothetical protein
MVANKCNLDVFFLFGKGLRKLTRKEVVNIVKYVLFVQKRVKDID